MVILFRLAWLAAVSGISFLATTASAHAISISHIDKVNHFAAFLVLAFLTHFAFPGKRSYTHIIMLLCFACAIELVQTSLPHRDFSVLDIVADIVGITAFYAIYFMVKKFWPKNTTK